MSQLEYQLEILKNFKYQNKILSYQYETLINNEILLKSIDIKINYIHEIINYYEKINTNNILLFCIFILQLFILFK